MPVYHYWPVKEVVPEVRTLVSYSDGAPALLERNFKGPKTGSVLMWTTPLSRVPDLGPGRRDPSAWSELPTSSGWGFFVLLNETIPYLANAQSDPLNFEAGQNVTLRLEPGTHVSSFSLTGPDGKTKAGVGHSANSGFLAADTPAQTGLWTVKAVSADGHERTLGFSINAPIQESKFKTAEKADLDAIFGKDGYKLADDSKALSGIETVTRLGYEMFPWLMFLILFVVTLENFLANTFYKEAPRPESAARAA